uniref:Uncharacterized protein n=1 Tax=Solanum lycopersicum TaxID=4081 RepID=A0A3Q7GG23_SOLLC
MEIAPEHGKQVIFLLKLKNAKKIIQIGLFSRYSILLTGLTIPNGCKASES